MSNDEAAKLITLLQEYARGQGSAIFAFVSVRAQFSSSISTTESFSICAEMLADSIVSVIDTLSKSLLSQSVQRYSSGPGGHKPNRNGDTVLKALFVSSLQFLTSFVSSSALWACAAIKAISVRFEYSGPNSLTEVMRRLTTQCDTVTSDYTVTSQVCSLFHAVLESACVHGFVATTATQQLSSLMLTYLLDVLIESDRYPYSVDQRGPLSRPSLIRWRGRLTEQCLCTIYLLLSHAPSPLFSEKDILSSRTLSGPLGEQLIARFSQDFRLLRAVLRAAAELSLSAALSAPGSQSQKPTVTSKRVFKAPTTGTKIISHSESVLPIDYSYVFSTYSPAG
jgi:hypothetical protein